MQTFAWLFTADLTFASTKFTVTTECQGTYPFTPWQFYSMKSAAQRESITFLWNSLTGFQRRRQSILPLICISNCFGIGPCFPITLLKTSQAFSAVPSLNIFVTGWILHAIHLFPVLKYGASQSTHGKAGSGLSSVNLLLCQRPETLDC